MRFFIGALALAVICVLVGAPAVLLLGRSPLTASDRYAISKSIKNSGAIVSSRESAQQAR